MFRFVVLFATLAGPAQASDPCHDLWFTRNLIFDRAGYCFGSALGQAIFDNRDCTTKDPGLSSADSASVARIRETETWIGCQVDTDATRLEVDGLEVRRTLDTLPVLDGHESTCIGWRGPVLALYAGVQPGARRIGQVTPGDTISFAYEFRDPYSFVTVHRDGGFRSLGWTSDGTMNEENCTQLAG